MFLLLALCLFLISARVDAQLVEGQAGVCQQTRIVPYIEYETREYYDTRKEWCMNPFKLFRCKIAFPRFEQVPVNKEREEQVLVCCEGWEFENGACIRHPPLPAENERGEEVHPVEETPAVLEPEVPAPMPEAPIFIPVVEVPAPTPAAPVEIPAESSHDNTETEVEVEPEHHEEKEETHEHEVPSPSIVVIPIENNDDHNEKENIVEEHHEEQVVDNDDPIVVVPFGHNEGNNDHDGHEDTVDEHHEEKEETHEHDEQPAALAAPVQTPIKHSHPAPSPTTEAPAHEPNHPIFEEIMDTPHEPYHPVFEEIMETPQEPAFEEDHWREAEHQEKQEDSDEYKPTDEQPKYHFEELIKFITGLRTHQEKKGSDESDPDEEDHWEEIPTEVRAEPAQHEPMEEQQEHWEEYPTVVHEEPAVAEHNATFESEAIAAANERFRAAIAASQAAAEAAHRAHEEAKAEQIASKIARFFAKVFFKRDPAPEQNEPSLEIIGEKMPHWLHLLQMLRRKESSSGRSEGELHAPDEAEEPSHPESAAEKNDHESPKPDEQTHVEEPLSPSPSLPQVEKVLQDTMADLSMTHIRMISRLHRAWASLHQHSPQENQKTPTLD